MVEAQQKSCCCCSCIFSVGLPIIFLWLAFRILSPTCSIEQFDIFALQNSSTNSSIHYDLKLKNRNFNKGIYYDALNLTFYYKPNRSFVVGNVTIAPFYQGFWKTAHRVGDVEPTGVNLGNGSTGSGTAVFRVELATKVRYRSPLWKSKRHRLVVGANLEVNDQGTLIKKGNKGIKLSSRAIKNEGCLKLMGIFGILFGILFV